MCLEQNIIEIFFKMGAELFRKFVSSWMIVCYRSVVRHPFLVGMVVFLFSMYRLFPLLFSVLVSASPVLVSTAVLLGTLLSFGQPNIPEIEKEPESRVRKLETRVMSSTEIIGRDGSLVADRSFEEITKVGDDSLLEFGEEKVVLGSRYSPLQQSEDEHIVLESDKLWEGSADPLNSNSGLLWKGMGGSGGGGGDDDDDDDGDDDDGDDGDDDDDDGSDSGSDIAESSSPDALMADIIPMLDELHPLLSEEQEAHQPSHVAHDGTDAVSEHSLESSDASSESNDDDDEDDTGIENHENLKVGDGEDEDKESKHDEKEDDTRSAITWTEDDQKNLMNLGTSELERNRRLENLIARRRARKTMRMQAEKNLIDLESADLPWNIPPISTSRNNPFDYDSNDNIPGSAPSVLSKRRNPFDLPYDSSEEKPDLVGDTFQQEFAVVQLKEPFFRRHESFNVGPSIFAASRSERQETKLKPYFVPERSFATFQRQFSGLSDSKASSVPDTDSVSSDLENKDHIEEDEHASEMDEHVSDDHVSHERPYFVPEHVASDETGFSSFQRQLSEVSDSKVSSKPDTESVSSASDLENKDHIDLSQEPDLISVEDHEHASEITEHVSEHVSLVNESFEEGEVSVESVTNQQELHSSGSSLSSSDEVSEQIYNEKEGGDEVAVGSVSETDYFLDRGSSIERSEIDVTSLLVEESQPNEPVYDLSPRSVTRNLSSSSISVDLLKDGSFLHTDDCNQSSSPAIPDNEEHVLAVDNISTSLPDKPILEVEDAVSDLDASHELEEVQVSSSNSHERSHETFHQEDVMFQPLTEDREELQARDLEHGEVALPSYEAQFTEVVHGETYENHSPTHGEDTSQLQKEFLLLDTSVNEPSEENPEVQVTSNNSDNLHIQEPDVVVVTDIETKAQEIPAYASDTHSVESSIDDVDEIKEIDEDLLVELDAVGDFSVSDLGSILDDMKKDLHASEDDLENNGIAKEDSYNNDLESNLSEMKQYSNVLEHDLETNHSVDEDSYSRDLGSTSNDMKPEYDIETKCSGDEDSDSKDLGTTSDERKQDSHVSDHDLETTVSGDEDSYSKVLGSTLDEMMQDPHASDHDLETEHSEEMKQDTHALDHDLETEHSEDIKQDPHASDHDLETKHSEDEDSYSKDATLDEMKPNPHASDYDLETKHSEDEDFYSKDATLDEMKQDPHALDHDLETNHFIDENSYSKDLDTTFTEMKQDTHALEHRLETFYSVDDNFYSKHAESTSNEMKHNIHDSHQDLETNHSGETKIKMDEEVMKSQNENDISNTKAEGAFQAEASKSMLTSEVVLPQETESTTSLVNSTSTTTVNHGTENASSTSNTDKE
ncbi:hypothetical protein L1987_77412 [Smallanthus sonchifolius]|uniref:Uncharacterized protein n=1 Tax=Smallanthus sonchifolius TaxID=185202 RepID=A0ACB8Z8Y0_9ASTR|nr:hypothetical protein L1987_77412 [Smallanthus sonchifolius]